VVTIAEFAAIFRPAEGEAGEYRSKPEKLALLDKAQGEWAKVNRWLIEYDAIPIDAKIRLPGVHRIMAVAAPGDLFHMGASFRGSTSWKADPFRQEYFLHNGVAFHRWPFNRTYSTGFLKKDAMIPGSLPRELLLMIIPTWPLTDFLLTDTGAQGARITPPEAVRSEDYSLRTETERVGSWDCAVFENQVKDHIWIGTAMGFCIIKRERRDPVSKLLIDRALALKVEEVSPGLWLPVEFQYQLFSIGGPMNHEMVEIDYRVSIIRCALSKEVPETIFIPKQAPGSLEYRADGRFVQVVPGGEDLLDEIATFAGRNHNLPAALANRMRWKCLRLLIAFSVGVGAGICWLELKSARLHQQPNSS
jgi:hypothetical protein